MRKKLNITLIILLIFIIASSISFVSASSDWNDVAINDETVMDIATDDIQEIEINSGETEEIESNSAETGETGLPHLLEDTIDDEAPADDLNTESSIANSSDISNDETSVLSTEKVETVRILPSDKAIGEIVYVDGKAKTSGEGTAEKPFQNLITAIKAAKNYDLIVLKPGTYTGKFNCNISINKEVSIGRWGDYGEVIFDGNESGFLFKCNKAVELMDLTFKNGVSDFGGAITLNDFSNVIRCTFINNRARYGGAVSIGNNKSCVFKNCTFTGNVASLGGGGIYTWNGSMAVCNSNFRNCISQFGGAIFSLNGTLILDNDKINDNQALEFGGGIYKKWGKLIIENGNYTHNSAYYDGGAIYIINGTGLIEGSYFENNIADYGGTSIHSISTVIDMQDLRFLSLSEKSIVDTPFINSFIDLGNYTMIVSDTSNFNGTIPSYFNLVDEGWVTSVKDQGNLGICWDYSAIAVVESAVKKATGLELDLSEGNLKNMIAEYSSYGWNRSSNDGGNTWTAFPYMMSALGPVLEVTDPTSEFGFSPMLKSILLISNIVCLSRDSANPLNNNHVKEAIMKYGAIRAGINADYHKGYNYYCYKDNDTNHAVTIVGWDDNYSKKNFGNNCPGNGAWIAKNSWGKDSGKNGYIYISYYDLSDGWDSLIYVNFNNTMKFDRVYQYDYGLHNYKKFTSVSSLAFKNVYTSVKDENIEAVSTFFFVDTDYKISVYVGNKLMHQQSGSSKGKGYFTFNLDKAIPVKKGETFSVVIEVNNNMVPCVYKSKNSQTCGDGASYVCLSSKGKWNDLNSYKSPCAAILKVYTGILGSMVSIEPIANVTYGDSISIAFNVENITAVDCILKKGGVIISTIENISGNNITFSNLGAGNYEITINNKGSSLIRNSSDSATFSVLKDTPTVTIAVSELSNAEELTVNITTDTPGTYLIKIGDKGKLVGFSEKGTKTVTLKNIPKGNYTISIEYTGTSNYNPVNKSINATVVKAPSNITIESVQSSNYQKNKTVVNYRLSHKGKAKAILINRDTGETIDVHMDITERQVIMEGLSAGNYTITLLENGNEITEACNKTVNFTLVDDEDYFICSYEV